jgi:hypothetical protein
MGHTCVEQYALCGGSFACIYVGTDANIAIAADGCLAGQCVFPFV